MPLRMIVFLQNQIKIIALISHLHTCMNLRFLCVSSFFCIGNGMEEDTATEMAKTMTKRANFIVIDLGSLNIVAIAPLQKLMEVSSDHERKTTA